MKEVDPKKHIYPCIWQQLLKKVEGFSNNNHELFSKLLGNWKHVVVMRSSVNEDHYMLKLPRRLNYNMKVLVLKSKFKLLSLYVDGYEGVFQEHAMAYNPFRPKIIGIVGEGGTQYALL